MAVPSTISRYAITDDTGDGESGDVLDAAFFGLAFYDKVDALLAAQLNLTGPLMVGDDANANMTIGLTLNQGAADNEILALKSSDVAHGITGQTETDTYGLMKKVQATDGGFEMQGLTEASIAVQIFPIYTTSIVTKTTGGVGAMNVDAYKKSGTSIAAPAANDNLLAVRAGGVTRFILDADGDSHQDVGTAWSNFDDYPDVELLHALSAGVSRKGDPLRRQFRALLEKHRPALTRARLVTFNRNGRHFVNWSRLHMLVIGAVRQQAAELAKTQAQLRRLQKRIEA